MEQLTLLMINIAILISSPANAHPHKKYNAQGSISQINISHMTHLRSSHDTESAFDKKYPKLISKNFMMLYECSLIFIMHQLKCAY